MESALRPFVCVGLAYFLIAVIAPVALLWRGGEKGGWTSKGVLWSMLSGVAGSLGALGVILALTAGGNPIYVMPLVFGGAPVVNTLMSAYFKLIARLFVNMRTTKNSEFFNLVRKWNRTSNRCPCPLRSAYYLLCASIKNTIVKGF